MALDARIHYRTFARIDRTPDICSRYWSKLFDTYKVGLNFDGELFGLGDTLDKLVSEGFLFGTEATSEICLNKVNDRASWLKHVVIRPYDNSVDVFHAWTLEHSRCNFVQCSLTERFFVRNVNSSWEEQN